MKKNCKVKINLSFKTQRTATETRNDKGDMDVPIKRILNFLLLSLTLPILFGCFNRNLRGYVKKSEDKNTYLVILEKDNPNCILYVDGQIWPYNIGQKGVIQQGIHKISCGGVIEIEIKKGTTFHFNYWGP